MKEKERIAAVRQRAHDEVQTLRNKIEQPKTRLMLLMKNVEVKAN